jgi:exopolysaccharide biosynthesis polyprenyl glycosylphosphotransferase
VTEPQRAPDSVGRASTRAEIPPSLLGRLNRRGFRLLMLLDAVAMFAASVAVMLVRFGVDWPDYPTWLYLVSFGVTTVIFVASFYLGGLYEREPRLGAPPVLPRALPQALVAGGFVALLTLVATGVGRELGLTTARALPFPILNLSIVIVLGALAATGNRRMAHLVRTGREGFPRVVLVGTDEERGRARDGLELEGARALVVAEVGAIEDVLAAVDEARATDVLLLSRDWLDAVFPDVIEHLEDAGITVLLRVTARETLLGLDRVREIAGTPFVLVRAHTIPVSRARLKRLFDLTVLLLAAPVWVPVLAAMALYQGLAVGRPLLYWQERVGRDGRAFRMVKFRTMRPDAEDDGLGPRLASPGDPRIIAACRWVRATRMDELPQLFNVLRGEMSLVGPRPERPELVAELAPRISGYERRHELPPGMTGLAQIYGRYHTDAEYKLGYDLQYLVNWSPVLDLEILFKTVWVVLARRL